MIEPKFNRDTGKYEVEAYGKTHEFNELQDAWDYANDVMNHYFSDPIYSTDLS